MDLLIFTGSCLSRGLSLAFAVWARAVADAMSPVKGSFILVARACRRGSRAKISCANSNLVSAALPDARVQGSFAGSGSVCMAVRRITTFRSIRRRSEGVQKGQGLSSQGFGRTSCNISGLGPPFGAASRAVFGTYWRSSRTSRKRLDEVFILVCKMSNFLRRRRQEH